MGRRHRPRLQEFPGTDLEGGRGIVDYRIGRYIPVMRFEDLGLNRPGSEGDQAAFGAKQTALDYLIGEKLKRSLAERETMRRSRDSSRVLVAVAHLQ